MIHNAIYAKRISETNQSFFYSFYRDGIEQTFR